MSPPAASAARSLRPPCMAKPVLPPAALRHCTLIQDALRHPLGERPSALSALLFQPSPHRVQLADVAAVKKAIELANSKHSSGDFRELYFGLFHNKCGYANCYYAGVGFE